MSSNLRFVRHVIVKTNSSFGEGSSEGTYLDEEAFATISIYEDPPALGYSTGNCILPLEILDKIYVHLELDDFMRLGVVNRKFYMHMMRLWYGNRALLLRVYKRQGFRLKSGNYFIDYGKRVQANIRLQHVWKSLKDYMGAAFIWNLNPPASRKSILKFEKHFSINLPYEFEASIMIHDGFRHDLDDNPVPMLYPLFEIWQKIISSEFVQSFQYENMIPVAKNVTLEITTGYVYNLVGFGKQPVKIHDRWSQYLIIY